MAERGSFINSINLKDATLKWMGRSQFRSKSKGTFWPSEASAEYINEYGEQCIMGKCHRAVYYRHKGYEVTDPPSPKSQIIFELGRQIENAMVEIWKQMGIWENNSLKWENKERNISGEYDVILKVNGSPIGVELKSFYGYYANKQIAGHSSGRGANKIWIPGRPKDENLMQAALYCWNEFDRIDGFKLYYVSRDKSDMYEFNIHVNEDGSIFINNLKDSRITMHSILNRYIRMASYIDNDIKPPREFTLYPSDERVEVLKNRGDISDSAYKAHITGKCKITDFHCSYCDYKRLCWNIDTDDLEEIPVITEGDEENEQG